MSLNQRLQGATLQVEARVLSQQAERGAGRHIFTRHTLEVFKVFSGTLPAGSLSVRTAGGTLDLERETVSSSPLILPGMQGVFLLEPDPTQAGEWRLYAGPQGFIGYDLATLSASEPFGHYASIGAALYPALAASQSTPYRELRPNADLLAATSRASRRTMAGPLAVNAPTISSFSPTTVTAGTATATTTSPDGVLTIVGTGFGAVQGRGFVQFRNADAPGPDTAPNYTKPLPSDYLAWSDTQIQVRVPSYSQTGNAAGTGKFQVADDSGTLSTSDTDLTVTYALANAFNTSDEQTYRLHLVNMDGSGGYMLHYSPSFPAAAQAPFERALASWSCQAGINRTIGAATSVNTISADGINAVLFSTTLETNVLGATYSYSISCPAAGSSPVFQVEETDYAFAAVPIPGYSWHYTPDGSLKQTEYDFESVALHEQGHGAQLTHVISAMDVMNFSLSNIDVKHTLDNATDIAAAQNVVAYSLSAKAADLCYNEYQANTQYTLYTASNCTLPVVLTAFAARYQPGQGTRLSWATASEAGSLAFVVESQDDPTASTWQAVARVAAAGSSPTPRQYASLDARPLAGTRYYRLRQLDLDGRVAYSPVVAVTAATAALAAYPNPAAGLVHLSGPLAAGATAQVRLLDATGRCVASATGQVGQAAFDLPLAGVPAGLYVVEWHGGTGRSYLRLEVVF